MPYLNRDIKEVEKRIAILEKNQAKGTDEILIEGGKIVHNGEAQRLQIFFDGIPSKEVREALKAHAFKWAPTAKAWQRTLTENAKYAVNQYLINTGILKLRTALSAPHQEDEIAFLAAAGIDYFPEAPDDETLSDVFFEAMLYVANKCIPNELLRSIESNERVYRNVDQNAFLTYPDRPNFNDPDEHLMIDETLTYAVINEVAFLLNQDTYYRTLALEIIADYNANYGKEYGL